MSTKIYPKSKLNFEDSFKAYEEFSNKQCCLICVEKMFMHQLNMARNIHDYNYSNPITSSFDVSWDSKKKIYFTEIKLSGLNRDAIDYNLILYMIARYSRCDCGNSFDIKDYQVSSNKDETIIIVYLQCKNCGKWQNNLFHSFLDIINKFLHSITEIQISFYKIILKRR